MEKQETGKTLSSTPETLGEYLRKIIFDSLDKHRGLKNKVMDDLAVSERWFKNYLGKKTRGIIPPEGSKLREKAIEYCKKIMREEKYNRTKTARRLKISIRCLYDYIRKEKDFEEEVRGKWTKKDKEDDYNLFPSNEERLFYRDNPDKKYIKHKKENKC